MLSRSRRQPSKRPRWSLAKPQCPRRLRSQRLRGRAFGAALAGTLRQTCGTLGKSHPTLGYYGVVQRVGRPQEARKMDKGGPQSPRARAALLD